MSVKLERMPAPTLTEGPSAAKALENGATNKAAKDAVFRKRTCDLVWSEPMNYSPECFFLVAAEASGGVPVAVWAISPTAVVLPIDGAQSGHAHLYRARTARVRLIRTYVAALDAGMESARSPQSPGG